MNKKIQNLLLIIAPLFLIITFCVLVVFGVRGLDIISDTLDPIKNMTSSLSTQVAEVMHPTPTVLPDPITIIHDVRSMARLETIQYSVEKVITAEVGQGTFGFLTGDRLLFVAHGIVIAGIDLEKLMPDDLWVEEGVLYVHLPQAEIFLATLDNDQSYVYDREKGWLTKGMDELETLARQAAEDEIENSAIQDGILEQAQENAENYLWRLFSDLGFPEVIFVDQIDE